LRLLAAALRPVRESRRLRIAFAVDVSLSVTTGKWDRVPHDGESISPMGADRSGAIVSAIASLLSQQPGAAFRRREEATVRRVDARS